MGRAVYRIALLFTVAVCVGCASSSNDVRPQYVSHLQYQNLSCQQIGAEAQRVSRRVAEVSGVQDEKATSDAVVTGVALVIFWPAAFFVKGDGPTAAELGRLKGEFEALEKVAIEKRCGLEFRQHTADAAAKSAKRQAAVPSPANP